jgi:hypothetical protein
VLACAVLLVTLQLDSWSVGALAYDVLCGRAPFAVHEDIPREEEKHAILHEVCAPCAVWQLSFPTVDSIRLTE